MAIKWKGWTARLPVKICCVILIPVMAFVFLCGCVGIAGMDLGGMDWDILFITDFNNNDYFFNNMTYSVMHNAESLIYYGSEEDIRAMKCLEWKKNEYDDDGDGSYTLVSKPVYATGYATRQQSWGSVKDPEQPGSEASWMVGQAINEQMSEFRRARERLEKTEGLIYYIFSSGADMMLSNASEHTSQFFQQYPVYMLKEGQTVIAHSKQDSGSFGFYGDYDGPDDQIIYIAFTQEAVGAQNARWKTIQLQFGVQIALIGGSALAALVLFVILMAGAGRRCGDGGKAVRFTVLDKPWLDFGLGVLIFYEVALCYFIAMYTQAAWRYDNIRWIMLLCAILAVAFTLPVLWGLSSFAKRCKAGKWWRHTLIYWIYDKCRSFVKSLWAGVPLTAKVMLIVIASLAAMLFSIAAPPMCIVFAAVIALLLLRYARRLHLVEQGAKSASSGSYDKPIMVAGGELGSIAASINRISGGINAAVAESMKSERFKTELITNVSHDIRTPLTSLITYTDLLKNEGLDSEKAPEYLDVLIQKSARLKALTDDLFEASKAASGNIDVHLDMLDLPDFVLQVLGELDERVKASALDFRLNMPEHARVRADGRLLWRVMENLLSNVFKYAMKDSRVYIDVLPENDGYRLEVKNISEYPLNVDPSELTERFKRGDSARTDEGSGLGLSIAQSFVQAQGGRFSLSIDGDLFKAVIYLTKEEPD